MGGLSAGRVQSVAVKLICDRQREIDSFEAEEYWTITANLLSPEKEEFTAELVSLGENKVELKMKQRQKQLPRP